MEIVTIREAGCYVVAFPDHIMLESMKDWGSEFRSRLVEESHLDLLLDTNTHNFESVECLRWLREFLTQDSVVTQAISRVAFVQPDTQLVSGVISDSEACFTDRGGARENG